MPHLLYPKPFSAAILADVDSFDAGATDWGRDATDWIRCTEPTDSALQSMHDHPGNEVLLYCDPDEAHAVVGFGSLGATTWIINKVKEPIFVIPHVGIHKTFQGGPVGFKSVDEKYSRQIMGDLLGRAVARRTIERFVGLWVDPRNVFAQKLYTDVGFKAFTPLKGLNRMIWPF